MGGTAGGASGGPGTRWNGTARSPDAAGPGEARSTGGRPGGGCWCAGAAPDPAPPPGSPGASPPPGRSPTAFRAEVKRSSRESGAGVGPVSSVESSYSSPHQSSS
ncbi:hypothetical protein TNCT1_21400 [Streptomyces sp. 1-11]|nr:hypothetical protein TNCT1_21400 [Streptomyces sp. 1-11]